MSREVSNFDDVVDSRDIIKRIEEWDDSDDAEELKILKELAEEGEGSPDWNYGESLIRDSYFQEYAQQLAEDCGMTKEGNSWPNRCIDWEQAAEELQQDYMEIDWNGVGFWIRA